MNNELIVQLDYDYGASAYEIAVANGFIGTEKEWLDSLKGDAGINGKDGKDGINGKDGEPGRDGINGLDGEQGKRGFSIFHTVGYLSTPEELIQVGVKRNEVQEGDLLISSHANSNGRMAIINKVVDNTVEYSYFSDVKGAPGPAGPEGPEPDMTGYATEEYVDNKLGDVESLLSGV